MAGQEVPQIDVGQRSDLVEVHLLSLPLALHRQTTEHIDELHREFQLLEVQEAAGDGHDVPKRLRDLMMDLEARFSEFTEAPTEQLDDAIDRGMTSVDLVYRVPAEAREAALSLRDLLDEADRFCRTGETLLTLQTPPSALAYRNWYLNEFVRQISGEPPLPWSGD